MKARVIRPYTDKYSMESISKGTEIEITEERFGELSTGPRGIFVEKIAEEDLEKTSGETPKEVTNLVDEAEKVEMTEEAPKQTDTGETPAIIETEEKVTKKNAKK